MEEFHFHTSLFCPPSRYRLIN